MCNWQQVSPNYLMGWSDSSIANVEKVPVVEAIVDFEYVSHESIEIALPVVTDSKLAFYKQEDTSMDPLIRENTLVLTKSYTDAADGSLVVILPDGETKPLVRFLRYDKDRALFISENSLDNKTYTVDDATIIGDVIASINIFNTL